METPITDGTMEERAGGKKVECPEDGVAGGWSIATPRIFTLLASCKNVLIAGCGGGYDVLSGLPLFFHLRSQGKRVHLASLSFTDLPRLAKGFEYCDMCYKVCHVSDTFVPQVNIFCKNMHPPPFIQGYVPCGSSFYWKKYSKWSIFYVISFFMAGHVEASTTNRNSALLP